MAFGLLHRLPPGPLGGSRGAVQLVTHRLRLVGSLFGLDPLLNGGLQVRQELPLIVVQVAAGEASRGLRFLRRGGEAGTLSPPGRRRWFPLLEIDDFPW